MNRSEWALLLGLTLVAATGCDQSPKPAATEKNLEQALAAMSSETTDETNECGAIAYLAEAMPEDNSIGGFAEIYRGCDSVISAQLSYAGDEGGSIGYSLMVLNVAQAGLAGEGGSWSEIIDGNRAGMETMISNQQRIRADYLANSSASVDQLKRIPEEMTLPNGAKAMLFTDSDDWVLLSLLNERHALRIDISDMNWQGFSTEQAKEKVAGLVSKVKFDRL